MVHRQRRVIGFDYSPFPFARGRARILAVAAVLAGLFIAGLDVSDAAAQYRLAGTMAVGKDHVAFLELPNGGQVLVRKGSVVGSAKVIEVTEKSLRLSLPDRTLLLSLEGVGGGAPEVQSAAVRSSVDDDRGRVYTRTVSPDQVSRELAKTAAPGNAALPASDARLVAAQRIAPVLDLPAGSRLIMVRGNRVTSASAAIKQIEKDLAANDGVVYLDIEVQGKAGRVYLMPAQD